MSDPMNFNESIEAKDWRWSAAIYGLIQYFDFHHLPYNRDEIVSLEEKDFLKFNKEDITEERYFSFVEYFFHDEFWHLKAEKMLLYEEYTEEQIKEMNDYLHKNESMKKVFDKLQFDGTNKSQIQSLINDNRMFLTKETFRNKPNLYKNFSNKNQLLCDGQTQCRLNGYYVDAGKKGKSTAYRYSMDTFVGEDSIYFDFIIFAFSLGRESFFINDNCSIKHLLTTNQLIQKKMKEEKEQGNRNDVRAALFQAIIQASDFLDYDVEVMKKSQDKEYYETMFLRKAAIRVFQQIKNYKIFCYSYKITDDYYLNVQEQVTNGIINNILQDETIDFFLKVQEKENSTKYNFLISQLIQVNTYMKGAVMTDAMKSAYKSAKLIVDDKKIENNKIDAYRQKLISSIVFKDYDKFCTILLQLSSYTGVTMSFAYNLFEDFEANKELAYTFINTLNRNNFNNGEDIR